VRDYLLFIDTETSGLPKKWDLPYSDNDNWPYAVQVAWVIFTRNGKEIKKENFYVNDDDFEITPAAYRIHGISREFLLQHGESREKILKVLAADLMLYRPLVVGHYMQLDFQVLGADFYRIGLENPLKNFPTFCTMQATAKYVSSPKSKYLRLDRLFYILFYTDLKNQHQALADAQATAACFFEMVKLGDINNESIIQQQQKPSKVNDSPTGLGCNSILILIISVLTFLFSIWQ